MWEQDFSQTYSFLEKLKNQEFFHFRASWLNFLIKTPKKVDFGLFWHNYAKDQTELMVGKLNNGLTKGLNT